MKNSSRITRSLCVLAVTAALSGVQVFGATTTNATWTGGGGGSTGWNTTANWASALQPDGGGTSIIHFGGTTSLTPNNDYGAYTQFNQIFFDSGAGAFTLTGAAIKLNVNGGSAAKIQNNSTSLETVSFNTSGYSVIFNSNGELNPVAGDLTINNDVTFDGGGLLSVFGNAGKTLTLNGVLKNGGVTVSLTNQNNNIIVLNNTMTYSGDTTILAGKLQFTSAGSANNSSIRIGSTNGATAAEIDLITAAGGTTISSTINPVTTTGTGTVTLASQNTSNTNTVSGHIGMDRDFTITQTAGGTLAITQARAGGVGTTTGTDIKGFTLTLTPTGSGTGFINYSGDIYNSTGNGNVTKTGTGTATLSGTNTYSGTTTANGGTLVLNGTNSSAGATTLTSGNLNLGSGSNGGMASGLLTLGTGQIQSTDATARTLTNAITFSGNTTFGAGTVTTGALTFNGTADLGGTTRSLTVTNPTTATFAGPISSSTGTGVGITKLGSGTMTFSGTLANTYDGPTLISTGELDLNKTAGINAIAGNITIGDGTGTDALKLLASNQIANTSVVTLTNGGTATFNLNGNSEVIGALTDSTTGATTSTVTLGAGSLTFGDSSSRTYGGVITGTSASILEAAVAA